MKLIKISHKLQSRSLTRPKFIEVCFKIIVPILLLTLISVVLWILGSYHWNNHSPIAQIDKKIYIITSLWLLWILKFLIYDLDKPFLKTSQDPLQKHLQELQNRFRGAYQFLKKATLLRHGQTVHLTTLPWYLFIGPNSSGKTTLLARSEINFILQRQFHLENPEAFPTTEYCDFWVTRDICIVDVPGKYIQPSETHQSALPPAQHSFIWNFLLRLIKKYRGKHAIKGLIMALPLPELILHHDAETYPVVLQELVERMFELQKIFPYPLSLHLVITKCDLLPGFSEFFADTSSEEIHQNWGVILPPVQKAALHDLFADRFNALIKKLNQQLLWRLHQERNPLARPYIKDFPLQVERVKESILQFIKKFASSHLNISLQGIYLTSALQDKTKHDSQIIDDIDNSSERALQIFEQPTPPSRVFFVKQLFTQVLSGTPPKSSIVVSTNIWQYRSALIVASILITVVALFLGKDFERGIKQTYVVQNQLTEFKLSLEQFHNADEHLLKTLNLLDSLDNSAKINNAKFNILKLGSFYTHKSEEKTNLAYHQSLQTILLPEIKNYFEEHLQDPVNETTENVYAVMKAYLMLGDANHFQANFILETLKKVLPHSMSENDLNRLSKHLKIALIAWKPLSLDVNTIQQTRSYLTSLPDIKLSYIILKNITNNNIENNISLLNANKNTVFKNKQLYNEIPSMFTAKTFLNIFSQGTTTASQEAVFGNWILGTIPGINKNKETAETLAKQLRVTYVTHYITVWENVLNNVSLIEPKDLSQIDSILLTLISDTSPLIQLLHTFHENTYFDPIASSSSLLQNVGVLFDHHNQSDNELNQIIVSLKSLHEMVHTILTAENEQKAAFDVISNRAKNPNSTDAISALRIVAQKSPEPIKHWLDKLANDTWRFLMKEGIHYIDISWQDKVIRNYETDIANRYPFSNKTQHEVNLAQFINFFGNPGIIMNFYNDFLKMLVDTSSTQWHWKNINENKLPLSDETLKQIQQAMRIQHTFFPNGDAKPYIQFALTPYRFDKRIKSVKLSINDKEITDKISDSKNQHFITWPSITKWNSKWTMTSVQLTMVNDKMIIRDYPGVWGWFKLINQSFENAFSENQMLINLSSKNYEPVRYLLSTQRQVNPFLSLNLHHFHLSQQITDNKA